MKQGKDTHRPRRGFSIVEAMVAVGFLGVGLLMMVKLHHVSIDGMAKSAAQTQAAEVARQIVEEITAGQTALQTNFGSTLPPCPVVGPPWPAPIAFPLDPVLGCRANRDPPTYRGLKPLGVCTFFYDGPPTRRQTGAAYPSAGAYQERYRVDIEIVNHPNTTSHPDTPIVFASVCWLDKDGFLQQVQGSRLIRRGF